MHDPPRLRTARLTLVAITPEIVDALAVPAAAEALLGARIPQGWPDDELAEILPATASADGFGPWAALAGGEVVGGAGFLGPPRDGAVELGYGFLPNARGRGYAAEASAALLEWALAQPGVARVVSRCEPTNTASRRVLEKLGMTPLGESGGYLHWERRRRMHADEIDTDEALVRRLLAAQFPLWSGLSITRVASTGTVNALYRLGDEMVVRLPLAAWGTGAIEHDLRWLPRLAPLLPVEIPAPLAQGDPGEGFPWTWGVYSWLDGRHPPLDRAAGSDVLLADLLRFLQALRAVDLPGSPDSGRGALADRDEATRAAIVTLRGEIDAPAATALWDAALATTWTAPVWVHGDLLPGNLLLRDGRLSGVLDWGVAGLGDPALDLLVAWGLLPPPARDRFRAALRVDDETWLRGRGWALSVGLVALPYYRETNPGLAATARHLVEEALTNVRSVSFGP